MEVKKEQVAQGVIKFMRNDVIGHVEDQATKLLLGLAASAIELNANILDGILENEMLSLFIKSKNGGYDFSAIEQAASKAISEYGELTITIPAIKFISPTEKILRFNAEDVKRLRSYIEGRM